MKGVWRKVLSVAAVSFLCVVSFLPMTVASAETTLYYIERGDTLNKIAKRFDTSVDALVSLNDIVNPDEINAGNALHVPVEGGTVRATTVPFDYIVVRGDTLDKIARRFDTTASNLASLNGIDNPDYISIGQRLQIQSGQSSSQVPENHYLVVEGDTLRRIARRFGVSMENLMQLNGIEDPNLIYEGQLLRLQ